MCCAVWDCRNFPRTRYGVRQRPLYLGVSGTATCPKLPRLSRFCVILDQRRGCLTRFLADFFHPWGGGGARFAARANGEEVGSSDTPD